MDFNNQKKYVGIFEVVHEGVTFYFIDNEEYFAGDKPYGDWFWDLQKFCFFCRAALSALPVIGFKPDVVHCHDWQSGLVPVLLKDSFRGGEFFKDMKSVMTSHNLKFQGVWSIQGMKDITGLPDYYFTNDKLEAYGDANMLKGGIVYADKVTTVSSTYSEEIKTPFYGEKLDGLMNARSKDLLGIVNGIDYEVYNPDTDKNIFVNYNAENWREKKVENKLKLQEELGLPVDKDKYMIGLVSRLTDQKGLDLINAVMEGIVDDNTQLVVIGTGEGRYENMFRHYAWTRPGQVSANICYSNQLAQKLYAAADAFLMPSRFEPCGLTQLISFRYGTVPIVRETGGLKDTIIPYNEYEGTGDGFSFTNYDAGDMLNVINYSKKVFFEQKEQWNEMVDRGMAKDFSWAVSSEKYAGIYRWLIGW